MRSINFCDWCTYRRVSLACALGNDQVQGQQCQKVTFCAPAGFFSQDPRFYASHLSLGLQPETVLTCGRVWGVSWHELKSPGFVFRLPSSSCIRNICYGVCFRAGWSIQAVWGYPATATFPCGHGQQNYIPDFRGWHPGRTEGVSFRLLRWVYYVLNRHVWFS